MWRSDWLTKFAERKQATPAQIALAWLLAQKPWIAPILAPRSLIVSRKILRDAAQLAADDLRDIDTAVSDLAVPAPRYLEHLQRLIDR